MATEPSKQKLLWHGYAGIESYLSQFNMLSLDASRPKTIIRLQKFCLSSKAVEGACKNFISRHLKQTITRWKLRHAENMAALCSVIYSNDWNGYWKQACLLAKYWIVTQAFSLENVGLAEKRFCGILKAIVVMVRRAVD